MDLKISSDTNFCIGWWYELDWLILI